MAQNFRFAAGRPCLDLVATVSGRLGGAARDRLDGPEAVAAWLSGAGITTDAAPSDAEVNDLRALREAVYTLLGTRSGHARATSKAVDAAVSHINAVAAQTVPAPRLRVEHGKPVADQIDITVRDALALLARDTVDLLSGGDVDRLHQCEDGGCGTYFLDTSRAGKRRWCSSQSCGNRARVNAYRAQQTSR